MTEEHRRLIWSTLSSELIFFILFQYINFSSFVDRLSKEISKIPKKQRVGRGRDETMWTLLQYISGSIGKNSLTEFTCVLKLLRVLYWELDPLPAPDISRPDSVRALAGAAILFMLRNKARQVSEEASGNGGQKFGVRFAPPPALAAHSDFLRRLATQEFDLVASARGDFRVPALCNTYSTCQEVFTPTMAAVYKAIGASADVQETTPLPGGGSAASGSPSAGTTTTLAQAPTEPLTMDFLDSLSVHAKMSLIHSVVTYVVKQVATGASLAVSPALVETYCRILVYTEIESLGLKSLMNQLLPQVTFSPHLNSHLKTMLSAQVFKLGAWRELHMLLEIFSFRLHHIQPHFRLTMLNHLQVGLGGGMQVAITKNFQLNLCLESTALRLITGECLLRL